jgi:Glycosyl hydrolase family 9
MHGITAILLLSRWSFMLQVGTVQQDWGGPDPGDFDCFIRAEHMPKEPNCPKRQRVTLLADSQEPASDAAAETAAALIASAALLVQEYPLFADFAVKTSHALYDFSTRYPDTAVSRSWVVNATYPTTNPAQNRIWAGAMLAWIHGCDDPDWPLCDKQYASKALANAEEEFQSDLVRCCNEHLAFVVHCADDSPHHQSAQ